MKRFMIGIMCLVIAENSFCDSLTKKVWNATSGNFLDGKLNYGEIHWTTGPGEKDTIDGSWHLVKGAGRDYRDTVLEAPQAVKNIYNLGIIQSYVNYKAMVGDNWAFAKLSLRDFNDASQSYIEEGNWAVLQCGYYYLKGSSRTVWALGVLNSSEAVYSIGRVGVMTGYYILEHPVGGTFKMALAPIAFAGGTVWSFTTSVVTAGWALPFAVIIDAGKLVTGNL